MCSRQAPSERQSPTTSAVKTTAREPVTVGNSNPGASEQLRLVGERLRPSLVMLACPFGGFGSGFVISRRHRLVATAAHAADLFSHGLESFAILDGTASALKVKRVWYHPGTLRVMDEGLHVRSFEPGDGLISNRGPDVAVLELSDDGHVLPLELELAGDEMLRMLGGRPAGLLGYPGSIEVPEVTQRPVASASFCVSQIGKMTSQFQSEDVPFEQRQLVFFRGALGDGASGSPLFLTSGQVAAVYVAGPDVLASEQGFRQCAFRVDCLRELLTYHRLGIYSDRTGDKPRTGWGPDPHLREFRKAVSLVRDAKRLRSREEYSNAAVRCSEAIALAPQYGGAFIERSKDRLYLLGNQWNKLTPQDMSSYQDAAFRDSYHCLEMFPEWNYARLIHTQNSIYTAVLRPEPSWFQPVIEDMNKMLGDNPGLDPLTPWERSFAINCRAQCHVFLGQAESGSLDYAESIRLAPDEPRWYVNRADFWNKNGRPDLAKADLLRAELIRDRRKALPSHGEE